MEEWRTVLYPLGFLSAFAFGGRFIIQWIQSEKAQRSVVHRSFWHLSLLGNFLLLIHSFIQMQFHVCLVQVCNGVFSWRNLNLMQNKRAPCSFAQVKLILIGSISSVIFLFLLQDWFLTQQESWFRIPIAPWQKFTTPSVSFSWHLLGATAYLLFSSRFWIQWWIAEKTYTSKLPLTFWFLSLIGAFLSMIYFIRIGDSVNLIGPVTGIIPYVRNIMLLKKNKPFIAKS